MSKNHLATYLNDHLAGSVAALDMLEDLAVHSKHLHTEMLKLRSEIEADRDILSALMLGLEIPQSTIRKAGGWISSYVAQMKLLFDDKATGSLRRLETLEALALGIQGKKGLWHALQAASELDTRLTGISYRDLVQRAVDQHGQVEAWRIAAAKEALTLAKP